ncbi:Uncharacterised protein [Streptococcus pneumoniae]|nr:Uncharacterised protein [Streptococcus pneumoniae]
MAERFWENLSIILAERNISWIELTRKMFAGEFHYPSELNRLYQRFATRRWNNECLKVHG